MTDKLNAEVTDDCIIPPELPKTELRNLVMEQSEHDVQEIVDYIEWQCNTKRERELEEVEETKLEQEEVQHAEKIKTERVIGTDYSVGTFTRISIVGGLLPTRQTSILKPSCLASTTRCRSI